MSFSKDVKFKVAGEEEKGPPAFDLAALADLREEWAQVVAKAWEAGTRASIRKFRLDKRDRTVFVIRLLHEQILPLETVQTWLCFDEQPRPVKLTNTISQGPGGGTSVSWQCEAVNPDEYGITVADFMKVFEKLKRGDINE